MLSFPIQVNDWLFIMSNFASLDLTNKSCIAFIYVYKNSRRWPINAPFWILHCLRLLHFFTLASIIIYFTSFFSVSLLFSHSFALHPLNATVLWAPSKIVKVKTMKWTNNPIQTIKSKIWWKIQAAYVDFYDWIEYTCTLYRVQ